MKPAVSEKHIKQLIEEAIVDAYGEDEQLAGFHCLLEEHLRFPFPASVIGEVIGIDIGDRGITANCKRGGQTHSIDLLSLRCDWVSIEGGDALIAYRTWAKGNLDEKSDR